MLATHVLGRAEELLRERKLPLGLRLWSGESVMPPERPRVTITLRSPRVLSSLVNSTMGNLARHYVEQELDIDGDLREVMRLCETLTSGPIVKRTRFRLGTWLHSRLVDRNAIRFHYDVGNDFFGLWLDRRRVYSCAYFRSANDSLDLA